MAIVKTFTVFNTTAGAGTVDIQLTDASASATHAIRHFDSTAYAGKTTVNVTSNGPIVLESADILKINTSVQPANAFGVSNGSKRGAKRCIMPMPPLLSLIYRV